MDEIIIRQEKEKDFNQIQEVVRLAFLQMEESDHTEHKLVERLHQSDAFIPELSLVAETADKKIVGYILLSEAKVVSGSLSHTVLAVAPLAVLPAFQGKGTGGMLIRAAHSKASELGYGVAVLLGHPDYYPKFGYQKASSFGIQFPFDAPDPCCMAIALKEHGLDGVQGMVSYPDAFYQ